MTSKLDEFKEIFYLHKLMNQLLADVTLRVDRLKPSALEEEANEVIRLVAELELVTREANERWKAWDEKYGTA